MKSHRRINKEQVDNSWFRSFGVSLSFVVVISVSFFLQFGIEALGWKFNSTTVFAQEPLPTPTIDRLAIPEMPEDPTEIDIGRNVYYHNCMPCHGDIGQGLTDEWREVWVDDHQNCWARGCHAGRESDLGFPIPTIVPAVIGKSAALYHFPSGEDLFNYINLNHPPQRPGALEEDESRAVTAFILMENGRYDPDMGSETESKDQIRTYLAGVSIVLICMFIMLFILVRRRKGVNSTETEGIIGSKERN